MASIQVPLAELAGADFPDVCAVSGEPTSRRVTIEFSWVPTWKRNAMWLPALPLVVVNRTDREQLALCLPISERVSRQYARRRQAGLLLLGLALVGVLVMPVVRESWFLVAVLLAGVSGTTTFVLARWRLPRLTVDPSQRAKLVGIAPAFRDALTPTGATARRDDRLPP